MAKIPVDVLEEETVEAMLAALIADPKLARQLGANARRYVEEHHTVNHMAAAYHRVLAPMVGGLEAPPVVDVEESIDPTMVVKPAAAEDPLTDQVARAMIELGLGSHAKLSLSVAESMVDLGLGPDKM